MLRPLLLLLLLAATTIPAEPAPAPAPTAAATSTVDPKTVEVWTTRTGKRYHRKTCQYAKIQSNLADALARGLTPCQVCRP